MTKTHTVQTRKPSARLRRRASQIANRLADAFPQPTTELHHQNTFELLVATILSAQCTDERVNMVTPELFRAYPDAHAMARSNPKQVETHINSLGLFRNKAKNLVAMAGDLVDQHDGVVPARRESLEALPGVGRKTASVVLSSGFGQPALAVDTHVQRVSQRLGLSDGGGPLRVEGDLTTLFPPEQWHDVHHGLILHGRRTCKARRPLCESCILSDLCPSQHKE